MAIIGAVHTRLCARINNFTRGFLISVCAEILQRFPSKISPRVTFKINGHLIGCTERYGNNHAKTNKKWR